MDSIKHAYIKVNTYPKTQVFEDGTCLMELYTQEEVDQTAERTKNVKTLSYDCQYTDYSINDLMKIDTVEYSQLQYLTLCNADVYDLDRMMGRLTKLLHLSLSDCKLISNEQDVVLHSDSLSKLNMYNSKIKTKDQTISLKGLTNLQTLALHDVAGTVQIGALNLKKLSLVDNYKTIDLSTVEYLTDLTALELTSHHGTIENWNSLQKLTALERLIIDYPRGHIPCNIPELCTNLQTLLINEFPWS